MSSVVQKQANSWLSLFASLLLVLMLNSQAVASNDLSYSEDRPANFVFLLDVSGSMVSPRTQVKAADGSSVTLFESLRQAIKQIVLDERLIGTNSKIAFITFGTVITEKSDWPVNLSTAAQRQKLVSDIQSTQELQADKHGDTYMAGGLETAYNRALQFAKESPSCTTTFIVMLTDGWDEPPQGAQYKVQDEAAKFIAKQNEVKQKLGVNTWQLRVVGLQRLPDKKAGTTTAAELAKMLGGEFIDVSKSQKGTVDERIYAALKETKDSLKGQIDMPSNDSADGIIDFGKISESPRLKSSVSVWNRSCYVEKLNGVHECSSTIKANDILRCRKAIEEMAAAGRFPEIPEHGKSLVLSSDLPSGAISLALAAPEILLAPVEREGAKAGQASGKVELEATVGSACPPGAYLGFLNFTSTARVPGNLAYVLAVPSRLTVDQDAVKVQIRKPGFIFDRDTSTELAFKLGAKVNSSHSSDFDVIVHASNAAMEAPLSDRSKTAPVLSSKLINRGEVLECKVNSGAAHGTPAKLEVLIPADTQAGRYAGKLSVKCKQHNELVSDAEVPYVIEVLASPWDEMSPIAIPVIAILLLMIIIGVYMAIIGSRDRI